MSWFRQHRCSLMRLTLGAWLLAVVVTAFQACLVQPDHSLTAPHETLSTMQQEHGHALHASGCLQYCEDVAQAVSPTAPTLAVDLFSLAILLLPVLILFTPAEKITFALLALRHPTPSGPPARLIFVRFND